MVIPGRHIVYIFWRYRNDALWNHRQIHILPVTVVDVRPEPITIIEPIPIAIVEIESIVIGHHIDIAYATGNYIDIRRCGKLIRRRGHDVDVDLHLCRRLLGYPEGKQHPGKKSQS
jgi:hypothetical protein